VLPALSAALLGALTAGAATLLGNSHPVADGQRVELAVENPDSADSDHADEIGSLSTGEASGEQTGEQDTPPSDTPTSTSGVPSSSSQRPGTTTEPAPPPPPASPRPQVTQEEQVVALVNAAREQSGCGPVTVVPELVDAAQGHSEDMAERDYFDHTNPDGVGFADRIIEAGYPSPGAENIAHGQESATQVMNGWMESDGHRANILNCQLKTIGVGLDKDGWYWTQNFGY
jgi:uncharacterized protein YkwD